VSLISWRCSPRKERFPPTSSSPCLEFVLPRRLKFFSVTFYPEEVFPKMNYRNSFYDSVSFISGSPFPTSFQSPAPGRVICRPVRKAFFRTLSPQTLIFLLRVAFNPWRPLFPTDEVLYRNPFGSLQKNLPAPPISRIAIFD